MTYNVFGGTLNPAQSNPIDEGDDHHSHTPPCYTLWSMKNETLLFFDNSGKY